MPARFSRCEDGSYVLRLGLGPDADLHIECIDGGWGARMGAERIPEAFRTPDEAQAAIVDMARRWLHEARERLT